MADADNRERTAPTLTPVNWRWWTVARTTLLVEVVGIILLALGALYTVRSVRAATDAVNASYDQLVESRYQAVFERQLELWKLAIEHPEAGAHYMVGTPYNSTPTEEQKRETKRQAATASALDFYVYAWQLAPRDPETNVVPGNLEPQSVPRPEYVSEKAWADWSTWASTIVHGFRDAPELCRQLADEASSYGYDFVSAVQGATRDCSAASS